MTSNDSVFKKNDSSEFFFLLIVIFYFRTDQILLFKLLFSGQVYVNLVVWKILNCRALGTVITKLIFLGRIWQFNVWFYLICWVLKLLISILLYRCLERYKSSVSTFLEVKSYPFGLIYDNTFNDLSDTHTVFAKGGTSLGRKLLLVWGWHCIRILEIKEGQIPLWSCFRQCVRSLTKW